MGQPCTRCIAQYICQEFNRIYMSTADKDTLQLVTVQDNKLCINEEALQLFEQRSNPLAIVSACGEYRTGKSFLLNSLFGQNGHFDVSSTIQPCTQGISLLKRPLLHETSSGTVDVWVFDTEGFGSLQKDSLYDSKIFLLTLMLSDAVIYNSKGSLDEQSISKMALTCQEAASLANQIGLLEEFLQAKLFWVLRDFSLSLRNLQETEISPNQYLEQSLDSQKDKKDSHHAELERKIIKSIFRKRECVPLVRPCISEKSLSSLQSIGSGNSGGMSCDINSREESEPCIRKQFLTEIARLRSKILDSIRAKCTPKDEQNEEKTLFLQGGSFVLALRSYVKAINESSFSGGLTVSWEQILEVQSQKVAEAALEQINSLIEKYSLPMDKAAFTEFKGLLSELMGGHLKEIKSEDAREQFQAAVDKRVPLFYENNKCALKEQIGDALREATRQLEHKMLSLSTVSNFQSKIRNQFTRIQESCLIKFESHFLSAFVKTEAMLAVSSGLNQFWEQLACSLAKKWADEAGKTELACQELKRKNHELSQRLKEKSSSSEEASAKEISKVRAKNEEMMRNMKNYGEVIERMEKVNEKLKRELEIAMDAEQQLREESEAHRLLLENKLLEKESILSTLKEENNLVRFELRERDDLRSIYESTISSLKEGMRRMEMEHAEDTERYEREVSQKQEGMLQVVHNERCKYQELVGEWKSQEEELKSSLRDKEHAIEMLRAEAREMRACFERQVQEFMISSKMEMGMEIKKERAVQQQLQKEKEELAERVAQGQKLISQFQQDNKLLENQVSNLKREYKALESQSQNSKKDECSELTRCQQKLSVLKEEIERKEARIEAGAEEHARQAKKHEEEIRSLMERLNQSHVNQVENSKQKETYLRREFEIEKLEVVEKLKEAAARIEKLQKKSEALERQNGALKIEAESYRHNNELIRKQLNQLESQLNKDCDQCFTKDLQNQKLGEELKKIKELNWELELAIESTAKELIKLKAKSEEGEDSSDEAGTPIERQFNQDYFEHFSRSPQSKHPVSRTLQQESEKLAHSYMKKQEQHQQVVEMYKAKVESLLVANRRVREELQSAQCALESEKAKNSSAKQSKSKSEELFGYKINQMGTTAEFDSLTSELKNKVSELASENKRLRGTIERERSMLDRQDRDSLKVVNLHVMMKKARVEEVEAILKENTELKFQIEELAREAEQHKMPHGPLHERIKQLSHENDLMRIQNGQLRHIVEQAEETSEKLRGQAESLRGQVESLQGAVAKQRGELEDTVAHYEQKVAHLRASKEEIRSRLERQNCLSRREIERMKASMLEMNQSYSQLIQKREEELQLKIKHQPEKASKSYKERLNNLFL